MGNIPKQQPSKKITIKYSKSPQYHSGLVTGLYGGLSMQGYIAANLYCEKSDVPNSTSFSVASDGSITPENPEPAGNNTTREVLFCAMIDIDAAKAIRTWLDEKIALYDQISGLKSGDQSEVQFINTSKTE